jgi:hypothetical protein
MTIPTWEVDLYIEGPITLRNQINTRQQKGFRPDNPFYSDINIVDIPSGCRATVTAYAPNDKLAFQAAVFFFGQMLDALTLSVDCPLYLSLTERKRIITERNRQEVRRIIDQQEIEDAFGNAHHLAEHSPPFLRSLGWYRKGLYTEDPFDTFLAFWNAIEIVASSFYKYVGNIDQERAKKGSKSQIWECFKAIWGSCENWPNISGNDTWIDENYETRKDIAHGLNFVNIEKVELVANKNGVIRSVSHRFLKDWYETLLHLILLRQLWLIYDRVCIMLCR